MYPPAYSWKYLDIEDVISGFDGWELQGLALDGLLSLGRAVGREQESTCDLCSPSEH